MRIYVHIDHETKRESMSTIAPEVSLFDLFQQYYSYASDIIGADNKVSFQRLVDHPKILFRHPNTIIGNVNRHPISSFNTVMPLVTILGHIEDTESYVVVNDLWVPFVGLYNVDVAVIHPSPLIDAGVRKTMIDTFLADNP